MSELSLRLLELIAERYQKAEVGLTHLVSRKMVISDELVNFLINLMLDALSYNNRLRIPRDLIVLIRHQTGGGQLAGWERKSSLDKQRMLVLSAITGLALAGKPMTIRAISKKIGVSATTVMRWYPEGSLAEMLIEFGAMVRTHRKSMK